MEDKNTQSEPLLSTREVMRLFGYKSRAAFHVWFRKAGVPFIQMSPRRIAFERSAIEQWKASRTQEGIAR